MEISKMITISTCHISEETSKEIENGININGLSVYDKEGYGWFIYISEYIDEFKVKIKPDLWACIQFAKDNDCEILCLDCDGEIINKLYEYEW